MGPGKVYKYYEEGKPSFQDIINNFNETPKFLGSSTPVNSYPQQKRGKKYRRSGNTSLHSSHTSVNSVNNSKTRQIFLHYNGYSSHITI